MAQSDLKSQVSAFLRRQTLLLSADGALTELEAPSAFGRQFRKPLVLLSRALCHHQPYTPPKRLAESKQDAAALLAGEVNPPFEQSKTLVLRGVPTYSIWSWNAELVERLMADRVGPYGADFEPETLHHRPQDGARIVEVEGGVEIQGWRGGALAASLFVPGLPTDADWQTFLTLWDNGESPTMPEPEVRCFALTGPTDRKVEADAVWDRLSIGAAALCSLLLVAGLFEVGENLRLNTAKTTERMAITRLDTARQGGSDDARAQRQITTLREVRSAYEKPDPVALLAEAYRLADAEGLTLTAFTVDTGRLRLGVEGAGPDALQAFALALEASASFSNVSPQTDRRSGATFFLADAVPGGRVS